MKEIDKAALGRRIKLIRKEVGLRQWELARMVGTTQSAVHKYERGVIPEPRRLMELARIGSTSIEWILTGRHWEDGSEERERLTPDLLRIARLLRGIDDRERSSVEEALRILRGAVSALGSAGTARPMADLVGAVADLQQYSAETLTLVEAAALIQRAVLHHLVRDAQGRFVSSPLLPRDPQSEPTRLRD